LAGIRLRLAAIRNPLPVVPHPLRKKAREEEWEQASDGTAEEQEVGAEGVKELMEVEGDGDGGV